MLFGVCCCFPENSQDLKKKVEEFDCKMADVLELDNVEEFEDGAGNDREVAVVEAMDDGAGGEDLSALKDKGTIFCLVTFCVLYHSKRFSPLSEDHHSRPSVHLFQQIVSTNFLRTR